MEYFVNYNIPFKYSCDIKIPKYVFFITKTDEMDLLK